MKRKYFTEFALNIYSSGPAIIRPSDLDKHEALDDKMKEYIKQCNIYVIGKRPRITIKKDSLTFEGRNLKGELVIQKQEGAVTEPFTATNFAPRDGFSAKSPDYPYNILQTYDENGEIFRLMPITLVVGLLEGNIWQHVDLEVVYVGQAFGPSGTRHAIDRLNSHSTLQKILSDISSNQPNEEVFLLLYPFEFHRFIMSMDGRSKPQICSGPGTLDTR